MKYNLDCPNCEGSIIKSYGEETKFRSKLIVWNPKGMFAVCKSCNCEVEVDPELLKSIKSSFVYEVNPDKNSKA